MSATHDSEVALAVQFTEHGLPAFPVALRWDVDHIAKRPLVGNGGFRNAGRTAGKVRRLFREVRRVDVPVGEGRDLGTEEVLGVGLWLGPAGLFALDVDTKNGARGDDELDALEAQHGKLPETLRVVTASGGAHLWFRKVNGQPGGFKRYEGQHIGNTTLAPSIDVRGDDGFVIAPGTETPWGVWAWDGPSFLRTEDAAPCVPALPSEWVFEQLAERASSNGACDADPAADIDLAALPARLRRLLDEEHVVGKRSDRIYHFVCVGIEASLDDATILAALSHFPPAADKGHVIRHGRRAIAAARANGVAPRAEDSSASDDSATQAAGNSDGWHVPVPLVGSSPPPKFPADVLPDTLADYVKGLATATQTPLDLPGVMVLGALAAAAGGRAVVEARTGWREPANLFFGVAMAPGNRKSAVVQEVTYPLHDGERQAIEAARDGIREAQVQRDVAQERARAAIRKAHSLTSDEDPKTLEQEAAEMAAMAEAITVPSVPRLLADDATPEALASLMAEQGGRIALISAEGGPFDMMAGRYSKVPNLDVYLKGHAGDHIRVDRQGRAGQIIESPALTVAVAFQPGIFPKIAAGEGFRARGLIARFLFSVPHSFVGYRQIGAAPVIPEVTEKYRTLIQSLVLTLADWTDPCILTFSPEAGERLLRLERWVEPRLAPGADLGMLADWGSKLAGAVVRIAGLLHLAANLTTGYREPISEETFLASARIGDYFLAHAIAAHGLMGADEVVEDARGLLTWIQQADLAHFSKRDAHHANRARFSKAADLDAPLDRLEDHGWIRRRPDPEPGTKGGRPPSPVYDVNPKTAAC
jgi:replicative DNA helicase